MHVTADDLVEALRQRGLRITNSRRVVCEVLAVSHDDHLTAADIRQRAIDSGAAKIDASTIYRTLDVLEELGHLHHVHFGHGPGVVHLTESRDHHHLVCEVCGRTVDIPLEEAEDLLSNLVGRHGFVGTSVHFALVGRCNDHTIAAG